MAILPAGTRLPPAGHAVALLLAAVLVGWGLYRRRPQVGDRTIVALTPWMGVGAALYVAYQLGLVPNGVAPFAGSPTVYATAAILAGAVWLAVERFVTDPCPPLAVVGVLGLIGVVAVLFADALSRGTLALTLPLVSVGIAALLAAVTWAGLAATVPTATTSTGWSGRLIVFAHALDGVSTAVGYDILGFGERSPLSRAIIDIASGLPSAELIGAGWLFVVVKVTLAVLAIWLLADVVRETPHEGYLLLGFVIAVGLGPGIHNVLLFSVVEAATTAV